MQKEREGFEGPEWEPSGRCSKALRKPQKPGPKASPK